MEASELMIGDWVYVEGEINRVGYDLMHLLCSRGNNWGIESIPLTEEILKANGFEHAWGTYAWIKDGFCLHCRLHGEPPYSIEIARKINVSNIMYVHELQQALRLCGLNELADNFKV